VEPRHGDADPLSEAGDDEDRRRADGEHEKVAQWDAAATIHLLTA